MDRNTISFCLIALVAWCGNGCAGRPVVRDNPTPVARVSSDPAPAPAVTKAESQAAPPPLVAQAESPGESITTDKDPVRSVPLDIPSSQTSAPPDGTTVTGQPPPPQVEVVGAPPRSDCVWMPGFWRWDKGWVWTSGCWGLPPYPNATWVSGHWMHRGDGWVWVRGYWRKSAG